MVERIDGMPQGTVGFRAGGEVTWEDYRQAIEPALRQAVESGEVRMLWVIDPDLEMDSGAVLEDAKVGLALGIGHHSAWSGPRWSPTSTGFAEQSGCSPG